MKPLPSLAVQRDLLGRPVSRNAEWNGGKETVSITNGLYRAGAAARIGRIAGFHESRIPDSGFRHSGFGFRHSPLHTPRRHGCRRIMEGGLKGKRQSC